MRRPLCFASLVFAVTVAVLLMLMPPQAASYEAYDGRSVTLTGCVAAKEFKTGSDGTISLAVTLKHISVEESPGTIQPPGAEPLSQNAAPPGAAPENTGRASSRFRRMTGEQGCSVSSGTGKPLPNHSTTASRSDLI
jgi:hypothetical protein